MSPGNNCAPEGAEAQGRTKRQQTDKANRSPSRGSRQDPRSDLYRKVENLEIAVRICKRLADSLTGEQAAGAMECLISLRLEIARTLALATRPA